MFGATTNFPFNFANRVGIPMIESNSVTSDGTNAIINIPNRAFKGDSATGEQMTGPGVYLIYYAKGSNLMQLMTYGPTAAVTKSTSSTNG